MRIIKHGDQYLLGEKTCPSCNCIFEYNKRDIVEHWDIEYNVPEVIVACPECKQPILLSSEEVLL